MTVLHGSLLEGDGGGAGVSGLTTADGGTALADNVIVRGDGTTGVQGSAITVADTTGAMSWGGDIGLARSAAGVLKVTDGSTGWGASYASALWSGTTATPLRVNDASTAPGTTNASNPLVTIGAATAAIGIASGQQVKFSTSNNAENTLATGIKGASGVVTITDGSTGIGKLLNSRLVEANTAVAASPNVLTATESGTVLTNEGATAENYHTLPTAVAGYQFTFICQDVDGIRVVANTGDTIRVIDKVTAAAGYLSSTTIGSYVTLVAINATEWFATSIGGVWTDGTFTYDDTSLTTP